MAAKKKSARHKPKHDKKAAKKEASKVAKKAKAAKRAAKTARKAPKRQKSGSKKGSKGTPNRGRRGVKGDLKQHGQHGPTCRRPQICSRIAVELERMTQ